MAFGKVVMFSGVMSGTGAVGLLIYVYTYLPPNAGAGGAGVAGLHSAFLLLTGFILAAVSAMMLIFGFLLILRRNRRERDD